MGTFSNLFFNNFDTFLMIFDFFQTYEAYTAAVASAAVDLDSETDSNHDTALTLACAGGSKFKSKNFKKYIYLILENLFFRS